MAFNELSSLLLCCALTVERVQRRVFVHRSFENKSKQIFLAPCDQDLRCLHILSFDREDSNRDREMRSLAVADQVHKFCRVYRYILAKYLSLQ